MSTSGNEAGRAADESLVHDGHLDEVLGQSANLVVIVVGLADPPQEAHRAGPPKLPLQHREHEALRLHDLLHGVAPVDHVDNLLQRRAVDLFVLGSEQNCRSTDELELAKRYDLAREEPVNVVDREEERLGKEAETLMDLNEPVHQDRPHGPLDLGLHVHIVRVRKKVVLG